MEQYIPKSVVLDEVKRRRDEALMRQQNLEAIGQETILNEMVANELNRIISFTDNLEVKEIDLDKDSELTWEDIQLIVSIDWDLDHSEFSCGKSTEEYYKEVLKQFKVERNK